MHLTTDCTPSLRMLGDRAQTPLHLIQERRPKPRALKFVVLNRLVQLALREPMKGDVNTHLSLARAARITVRAGLPTPVFASHS